MTSAMISPAGELADNTLDMSDIKSWKDEAADATGNTSASMAIAGLAHKQASKEKNRVKNIVSLLLVAKGYLSFYCQLQVKSFAGANQPVKIIQARQNTDIKTRNKGGVFNLT